MKNVLLVALGGALGSVARYLLASGVQRLLPATALPYGILSANIIGCFLIGLLAGLGEARALFSPQARLALFTGFLGGLTTFSTFAHDTFNMARGEASLLTAAVHVVAHLCLGLAAVYFGYLCSRAG